MRIVVGFSLSDERKFEINTKALIHRIHISLSILKEVI